MRRALIAISAAVIGLASVACSKPYQVPNLSPAGVVQNFPCEHVSDAASTMQTALQERDTDVLSAIGVTNENQEAIQTGLDARKKTCNEGVKQVENKAQSDGVDVVTQDGTRAHLPVVAGNGQMIKGDSTHDQETPPVATMSMLERCKNALGWDMLVSCVGNDDQWYKDGFTKMKPYTGYDWNDVVKWANAKDINDKAVDARVIHVYGKTEAEESKQQARDDVRPLIGDVAGDLEVVYHNDFVNSRGLEHDRVSPFVDRHPQVRVSLAPFILNEQGQVTGLRDNAGVFVDCLNIWGIQFAIAPAPGKPALCPGTNMPVPPEGPKGCHSPPTTTTPPPPPPGCVGEKCHPKPPCEGSQCHNITPKVRTDAPGQGGKGGSGPNGGDGTERHTADPTTAPPKAGTPGTTQPTSQPRPINTGVPVSATPTSTTQAQPPESGSNPTGGNGNTGDPGDF